MANTIYRSVRLSFWEDNKVVDDFSPEDKYFMLYLLTNPHTNMIGCYEVSVKQMSIELGYDTETTKKLINRMENVHKTIMFSSDTKEILIKNWWKYNWTKSPKLTKPIKCEIDNIKNSKFKDYMVSIGYQYGIYTVSEKEMIISRSNQGKDTVSIGYQYPMDTTVSVFINNNKNINNNIINYYINKINLNISEKETEILKKWINFFGKDHYEIMKYAIDIAIDNDAKSINYLEGIFNNWKKNGIKKIKTSDSDDELQTKIPDDLLKADWLNNEEGEKNDICY